MKNLGLLEADFEAEELCSAHKSEHDALQDSFWVDDKGCIICKEEVLDQPLQSLGVGLQAS